MRITAIRTLLMQAGPLGASAWGPVATSTTTGSRNWLFLIIETDAGISGIGEGSGWPRVVETAITDLAPLLLGDDPMASERIAQKLLAATMSHGMTGTVGGGAVTAIDMALWDIKGKALGVPVWQLLAGKMRDTVPCYRHASTPDQALEAKEAGYRAVKTGGVAMPVAKATAIRRAIGPEMDVAIDLHGPPWLTLPDATTICRALGDLDPLFVEEPLAPENLDGYRRLRDRVDVPLAAGERTAGLHGITPLLAEGLIDVAQPDSGRAGGITGLRKIAAVAEARFATIAPHSGSLGPVAEFAGLHVMASIPNALMMERMDPDWPGRASTITSQPVFRDGALVVPDAPGLGVEIDEAFVRAHPATRNIALAKGGWVAGTETETLFAQARRPRGTLRGG